MDKYLPMNPLAYYTAPRIESVYWQPERGMLLRPIEVCGVKFPAMMKTKYLKQWMEINEWRTQ